MGYLECQTNSKHLSVNVSSRSSVTAGQKQSSNNNDPNNGSDLHCWCLSEVQDHNAAGFDFFCNHCLSVYTDCS